MTSLHRVRVVRPIRAVHLLCAMTLAGCSSGTSGTSGANPDSGTPNGAPDSQMVSAVDGALVSPVIPAGIQKALIQGKAQKGPFVNGSAVTLSELDASLTATGRVFQAQILDDQGTFEIRNAQLASPIALLKADGYYFNEVGGKRSASPLTLYALADVAAKDSVNVNLITTLEKPRIEYLMSHAASASQGIDGAVQGITFADAAKQAETEVLAAFGFAGAPTASADSLDIAGQGAANAQLIAISVVLQGFRTPAELTELLSAMSTDMREDGMLDSVGSQAKLIAHAAYLDAARIRASLEGYYSDLGKSVKLADFETPLDQFKKTTAFVATAAASPIKMPAVGLYGANLLSPSTVDVKGGGDSSPGGKPGEPPAPATGGPEYSLQVELPEGIPSVKVVVEGPGIWFMQLGHQQNTIWTVFTQGTPSTQTFTMTGPGVCGTGIQFGPPGTYTLKVLVGDTVAYQRQVVVSNP